ncbi:MAG: hypothetical protein EZS28_027976 [Streblomastix strix]|uniref:Uncharacterized protein n=1 Tax=Streblomastix strix TaxID=222440 RepID=A0A5J4V1L5_9EUKA|nr:MAG: hypothetical protein EZS28_027976 [Streblomastix strix]
MVTSPNNKNINGPKIDSKIKQTIKDVYEKIVHDLRNNAEGDQKTRLAKQQEEYRLEKHQKQENEQVSKQKKREEFNKRANEVINELINEDEKERIAAKLACLKLMQEERKNPMSEQLN